MRVIGPLFLAALAVFPLVSALPGGENGLTLEQAVEIALARNPDVLAAEARIEAARGRTLQLKAPPEPQILGGIEGLPVPGLRREGDEIEIHLGIEQLFEYPGKRSLRTEIGRKGEDLAVAELERVRLLLAARVKKSYWTAAFARAAVAALERSTALLDAFLEDLEAKYGTGAASYADVLRARAEKARLRNQILDQSREKRTAELGLNELLGRSAHEPVDLLDGLPFAPLEADSAALWQKARLTLPSFRMSSLRTEQASAAEKLAALGRRPDFLAGFLLPSVRPGAWGISFGLTMPFLRPGRTRGEAIEAGAEAAASRIAAQALELRARAAIEGAYVAAKSAEQQVLVYEQSLLMELEDELGIELEYFRFGRIEAYSLIDLHRTHALAQVEHLRALLLYNIALADLEVAGEETD